MSFVPPAAFVISRAVPRQTYPGSGVTGRSPTVLVPHRFFHSVAVASWTPYPAFSIPSQWAIRPLCT